MAPSWLDLMAQPLTLMPPLTLKNASREEPTHKKRKKKLKGMARTLPIIKIQEVPAPMATKGGHVSCQHAPRPAGEKQVSAAPDWRSKMPFKGACLLLMLLSKFGTRVW